MTRRPVPTAAPDISHLTCRLCNKNSMEWVSIPSRVVTCSECKTLASNRRVKSWQAGERLCVAYVRPQVRSIMKKDGEIHLREYQSVLDNLARRGISTADVWRAGILALDSIV